MANDEKKAVEKTPEASPVVVFPTADAAPVGLDIAPGPTDLTKAKGDTVDVLPKTPEEIAERGTAIGNSNDPAAGGIPKKGDRAEGIGGATRLWSLDSDHTTDNRNGFDPLKPDCVEH